MEAEPTFMILITLKLNVIIPWPKRFLMLMAFNRTFEVNTTFRWIWSLDESVDRFKLMTLIELNYK